MRFNLLISPVERNKGGREAEAHGREKSRCSTLLGAPSMYQCRQKFTLEGCFFFNQNKTFLKRRIFSPENQKNRKARKRFLQGWQQGFVSLERGYEISNWLSWHCPGPAQLLNSVPFIFVAELWRFPHICLWKSRLLLMAAIWHSVCCISL